LALPASVTSALNDAANESPKPNDRAFAGSSFVLAARPADSLKAAEAMVRAAGYECISLGGDVEGEAREVALAHAQMARTLRAQGKRAVILSGGELTVTMRGKGKGGPNQEYALALVAALSGIPGVAAIAGDTDGTDGGGGAATDPAGAIVDGDSAARAKALGLDPAAFLANNDSTGFFAKMGDLLEPGPTYTNVNDFRAIVVERP
jgi:glycerate 2-kinase